MNTMFAIKSGCYAPLSLVQALCKVESVFLSMIRDAAQPTLQVSTDAHCVNL